MVFHATDMPVLPLALGSLMAGLISWRCVKAGRATSDNTHAPGEPAAPSETGKIVCRED
jgi:hypothetical protein